MTIVLANITLIHISNIQEIIFQGVKLHFEIEQKKKYHALAALFEQSSLKHLLTGYIKYCNYA